MVERNKERMTRTSDGKYTIVAKSWYLQPIAGLPSVMSESIVFLGEPNAEQSNWISKLAGDAVTADLLDGLQNAERVARDWIAKRERG